MMKLDLQISLRDIARSEPVEADIRKHVEKLELVCDRIISCRVTVEAPAQHRHQGRLFSAHVDVKVPGEEIASTRHHDHEDLYLAVRGAFDAVRRQLEEYTRRHANKRA